MISYEKQLKYIFFICLGVGFYFQMLGLTLPLLEEHSFRQTQTAITTYWFLKEGFQFAYQTPIFGVPWSVPMEFPLYQYLVYVFVKVFNIENLDFAGRTVSLIFYYALMYPLWQILKIFDVNKTAILYIFIILVTSPLFIFWSRTFMIESTGLYFTLMFIMYLLKYDKEDSILLKNLCFIFIFGTFAVLTKITTLLVGFIFIFFYLLLYRRIKTLLNKKSIIGILVVATIVAIGLIWNEFANVIKNNSALTVGLVSNNLNSWNFGTLSQRIDLKNYLLIFLNIGVNIPSFLLSIFLVPTILKYKIQFNKLSLIGFLTFFMSFIILFNLYKTHNYYWYANSIFAIIGIGILVYTVSQRYANYSFKILLLSFIIGINLSSYYFYYYKKQTDQLIGHRTMIIADLVKSNTKDNSIIVTMGLDWSSELPYYGQRKAILLTDSTNPTSSDFKNIYQKTTSINEIGALIICGEPLYKDNISKTIILSNFGHIQIDFIRKNFFGHIQNSLCDVYIRDVASEELNKSFYERNKLIKNNSISFFWRMN